jgi:ferredoxin/flavodoxin
MEKKMTSQIYYFTGTGNSLAIARELAEKLEADLINIASLEKVQTVTPAGDVIGIIAPVYHGNLPLITARFVDKLAGLESKYIFSVCTYGDHPGLFMEYMRDRLAIRGGRLSAGFGLHMPYNYVTPPKSMKDFYNSFTLRELDPAFQQGLLSAADERIPEILEAVQLRYTGILEKDSVFITRLVDAFNLHDSLGKSSWSKITGLNEPSTLTFNETRLRMDKAFTFTDSCGSCGTCEKICPVGDIRLVNGHPEWQHHCEQCFACLQWCPKQAIQFRGNTIGQKRYHHPRVTLKDMLNLAVPA